jgi:hypothetical protein
MFSSDDNLINTLALSPITWRFLCAFQLERPLNFWVQSTLADQMRYDGILSDALEISSKFAESNSQAIHHLFHRDPHQHHTEIINIVKRFI